MPVMNSNYVILKAGLNNAQAILELQKLAFRSEAELVNNFEIPPLMQTLESIQQDFHTYDFYKLVIDDQIVGAMKIRLLANNMLWIGRLIVHPDFQNRGLGKALMQYIEQKFDFVSGFELFTAQQSARNIRFYKNLGYSITDTFTEPGHADIELVKMIKTI
jgi:ribosomal protein S18 acetylase RimI-like enzyme